MSKPIPKFHSEDKEREFWDTEDSTEYLSDTEEVPPFELDGPVREAIENRDKKRSLTIRIGRREIEQARRIARNKGIGYQTLMRMWICEGINREVKG